MKILEKKFLSYDKNLKEYSQNFRRHVALGSPCFFETRGVRFEQNNNILLNYPRVSSKRGVKVFLCERNCDFYPVIFDHGDQYIK
jgi:hypothetical protein